MEAQAVAQVRDVVGPCPQVGAVEPFLNRRAGHAVLGQIGNDELNNFVFRFQLFKRFIGQHFAFVSDGRRPP